MPDDSKILKIVLQMQADTAAAVSQVKSGMKEIETQAAATAAAINGATSGTGASQVNWAQLGQERAAAMAAVNPIEEQSIANAQREALQQALIQAQMERRVILETQIEAAEARIAGDPAMAIKLEREAAIRTQALTIQRTLNITTEESIALAERMVIAEEATAVAANNVGINMAKAKTEALVLGREMAGGNVRASTLGSLLGSLGPEITIAGIAAYELYHFISGQVEETNKFHEALKKVSDDINSAAKQWKIEASAARSFEDTVKFADHAKQELARMAVDMAAFRAKEMPMWQKFWDAITTAGNESSAADSAEDRAKEKGRYATALQKELLEDEKEAVKEALKGLKEVTAETTNWGVVSADPAKHVQEYTDKLNQAHQATLAAKAAAEANPDRKNFDALAAAMDREKLAKTDLRNLQDMINTSTAKGHEIQKQITLETRDLANIIAQIQANKQLVQSNPFLSADQKAAATIRNDIQEVQALGVQLQRDQELQAKLTDPAQWSQMEGKIIQAKTRIIELGYEVQKTGFMGTIRAELTAWVNQFGTTAKQVATIITSTLNTAINATSQALTNVIFKTGDWKQAFAQAAQSIVQNIIQILLQWIVSKTIMKALSAVFKQADVQSTATAAAQSAAAWAAPATAASIATEGAADITGTAALAAAMVAGQTIVTGSSAAGGALGAAQGMYVGWGTHSTADDVPINVSIGEGIINARAVAAHGGKSWVDSINSGVSRTSYAGGGFAGARAASGSSGGGRSNNDIAIFNYTDLDKMRKHVMQSSAGRKIIIDTVSGAKLDIGLRS